MDGLGGARLEAERPGELAVALRRDEDGIGLPKVSEVGLLGPRSSWG